MFEFHPSIPTNLYSFLIPRLQAWIDREDVPVFGLETARYGLVRFVRTPWPRNGAATVVAPFGEQDQAACDAYSLVIGG